MNIIKSFIKHCHNIYIKLPRIDYNSNELTYYSINSFLLSNRKDNDDNNTIRENVIGAIINDKIPMEYYRYSPRWILLRKNIDNYIEILLEKSNRNISIESKKCIHRGGRMYHYDFNIIVNNTIHFDVELKFNSGNMSDIPQFVSPMKPSQYLSNNYEEYYYDGYLSKLASLGKFELPDRTEYLKTIHSPNPICIIDYQQKYYNGCKSSNKYSSIDEDIEFYQYSIETSKESILNFIKETELDIDKLSNYLLDTQKNKVYMLFKNNKFNYETMNLDDYIITGYTKEASKSRYIATTKTNIKMNILLRWKNGNGIAYPAFQIKALNTAKDN